MSYQVLARKWRPRSFTDLVGQGHVVKALSNALERGQLHHAYLFTGTRGVGKTTLARILAKALNCEQGVGAQPCGQCSACQEIDEGRFVDLLEVDAASRTKVDQTRELLDNVPFAPVKGRFKVYLIDEVHMFSAHSFNALLKTLEEPPPHVKFLLATTDPQKVPATVLSRCLQFNLKRLVPEQISDRFASILEAEGIAFEPPALTLLAHAADGSMRDGLSLLDQSIAFGGGKVAADEVRTMLGTVGRELGLNLLQALARLDRPGLLDEVARIAELTPDFAGVLHELIGLLHRVALYQEVPATLREDDPDRERVADLAGQLAPEDVQLFYQIALLGQQDLPLAPDPRTGIEMVLLRMLTFRPDPGDAPRTERRPQGPARSPAPARDVRGNATAPQEELPAGRATARHPPGANGPAQAPQAPVAPPPPAASTVEEGVAKAPLPPGESLPRAQQGGLEGDQRAKSGAFCDTLAEEGTPERGGEDSGLSQATEAVAGATAAEPHPQEGIAKAPLPAGREPAPSTARGLGERGSKGEDRCLLRHPPQGTGLRGPEDWHRLVAGLGLGGVASQLANNCELASWDGHRLSLTLDPECQNLRVSSAEERLKGALAQVLGEGLKVEIRISHPERETPAQRQVRHQAQHRAEAEALLENDPVARSLRDEFDARWVPGSIEPTPQDP